MNKIALIEFGMYTRKVGLFKEKVSVIINIKLYKICILITKSRLRLKIDQSTYHNPA